MKIATWNVNSVKVRLGHLLDYLKEAEPDVLLLQEIKCQDDGFPRFEVQAAGYHVETHGQKSYNGVAILSRKAPANVTRGLPGMEQDPQARYMEANFDGIRIATIYLPNGNPAPGDKFDYKLAWMRALLAQVDRLLDAETPFVLGGDYNLCPTSADVFDPVGFAGDALCLPQSRALYREMLWRGLTDSFRALNPDLPEAWSYFDYQAGAWEKGHGLRIDHLLLSPQTADRLLDSGIDRDMRARKQPSDHVPVWCTLS